VIMVVFLKLFINNLKKQNRYDRNVWNWQWKIIMIRFNQSKEKVEKYGFSKWN
jgi:hypothetical protein